MDSLYIVMPAYNENETIRSVIDQWYPVVEKIGGDSRLVIVNDGSKDETYEIMKECAQQRPLFIPLTKENGGHGAAVLYAYKYALSKLGGQKAIFSRQTQTARLCRRNFRRSGNCAVNMIWSSVTEAVVRMAFQEYL